MNGLSRGALELSPGDSQTADPGYFWKRSTNELILVVS